MYPRGVLAVSDRCRTFDIRVDLRHSRAGKSHLINKRRCCHGAVRRVGPDSE